MKIKPIFFLLILLPLLYLPVASTAAQTGNRAGIVIDWGNGQMETYCIDFNEEEISGFEALQRTGLPIEVDVNAGLGAAVCSIGGHGCPGTNCFCDCPGGGNCSFWSYWHLNDGSWQFSLGGASNAILHHGDVDGWVWGAGSQNSASPPVSTTFDQICTAAAPPTDTPIPPTNTLPPPTQTPIPPTNTPLPTHTVMPTDTAEPEIKFAAAATTIQRGNCTHLNWEVTNVRAVYLDGAGVSGKASQSVCPTQTQIYHLRVVTATGEKTREITIQVIDTAVMATTILQPTLTAVIPNTPVQVASAPQNPTLVPTLGVIAAATPTELTKLTPTPTLTHTPEMIMIQVPLANTPTSAPSPEVIALVPTAVAPTNIPVPQQPTAAPSIDWLGYGSFALIVTILALGLIFVRRQ